MEYKGPVKHLAYCLLFLSCVSFTALYGCSGLAPSKSPLELQHEEPVSAEKDTDKRVGVGLPTKDQTQLLRSSDPFVQGLTVLFIPAPYEAPMVPADVGLGDPGLPAQVSIAFQQAYERACISFIPLTGVLGADKLHRWSNKTREGKTISALVQNWQSRVPLANGWGLPSLVLAMDGEDGGAVYPIFPPILDTFSQNRGNGRTAGLAGYGKPVTGPFLVQEGNGYVVGQRFSAALITGILNEKGLSQGNVILEAPPSQAIVPRKEVGLRADNSMVESFKKAWFKALDLGVFQSGFGIPDGYVRFMDVVPADKTGSPGDRIGFVFQTFDSTRWAIVQPAGTSSEPFIIHRPFIDVFLNFHPDADTALAKALSVYGLPVADGYALPLVYLVQHPEIKTVLDQTVKAEHPYVPVMVQRYQRGIWLAFPSNAER